MSYSKLISFQRNKITLELNSDADESVLNEIFIDREYRELEASIMNAKRPIVDIGAHIGLFTIYSRILNPTVPVFAFEPEENNFALLKTNLKTNHIDNVIAKNLAVSGTCGQAKLYLHHDSHNHSLIEESALNTKSIQTISLQDIFARNKFENISIMKMDCEGSEFAIIANTPKEILAKIETIYIEYHQYNENLDPQELLKKLKQSSFLTNLRASRYDQRFGFILAKKIKNA